MFAKLENKGQTCLFAEYSEEHANDTYRLYMADSKRIVQARDGLWLNKKYKITKKIMTVL